MQRRATRQSPAPCAGAKALIKWIKERGICAACGADGGVIAHHFCGSSAKQRVGLERSYIGPWAVNGLCQGCDDIVTHGTRAAFRDLYGPESQVWLEQIKEYPGGVPELIIEGVKLCGK